MTLNGVMAVILRYVTELVYDVVLTTFIYAPRFPNLLLIVCDHIKTICAIYLGIIWAKQTPITRFDGPVTILCYSTDFELVILVSLTHIYCLVMILQPVSLVEFHLQ